MGGREQVGGRLSLPGGQGPRLCRELSGMRAGLLASCWSAWLGASFFSPGRGARSPSRRHRHTRFREGDAEWCKHAESAFALVSHRALEFARLGVPGSGSRSDVRERCALHPGPALSCVQQARTGPCGRAGSDQAPGTRPAAPGMRSRHLGGRGHPFPGGRQRQREGRPLPGRGV